MIGTVELAAVVDRTKQLLGITDATQDTEVEAAAEHAAGLVENYLNRSIFYSEVVDSLFVGNPPIFLSTWPIEAVSEVLLDTVVYAATDYILDTVRGVLISKNLPSYFEVATVKFTGGYEVPLPIWLLEATAMTAVSIFNSTGDGADGGDQPVRSDTLVGVMKIDYDTKSLGNLDSGEDFGPIPQGAITLLRPYRENVAR